MKDTKLFVVVPCYNEEEVLGETSSRLDKLFAKMVLGRAFKSGEQSGVRRRRQ